MYRGEVMKKFSLLVCTILLLTAMVLSANLTFAEELTAQEKSAFIVRDEWTSWVNEFTAQLEQLDKEATQKIYDDMDFYDMQYRFTEKYKTSQYIDQTTGQPTDELKALIKEKRKQRNRGQ